MIHGRRQGDEDPVRMAAVESLLSSQDETAAERNKGNPRNTL
jgi:hypothetical protein